MQHNAIETISQSSLCNRLEQEPANNQNSRKGFALVNVLGKEQFAKEHIPNSINIPKGEEAEFEKRFANDKEIIVYCASPECDASPTVARELQKRGFSNIIDFDGGMTSWKDAGGSVESAA